MAASLRKLWAMQTKAHSVSAFSRPRRWNLRKPILCFTSPKVVSGSIQRSCRKAMPGVDPIQRTVVGLGKGAKECLEPIHPIRRNIASRSWNWPELGGVRKTWVMGVWPVGDHSSVINNGTGMTGAAGVNPLLEFRI
jgi:hypothetical protein